MRSHSPSRLPRSAAGHSGCWATAASSRAFSSIILGICCQVNIRRISTRMASGWRCSASTGQRSSRCSSSAGLREASRSPASASMTARAASRSPQCSKACKAWRYWAFWAYQRPYRCQTSVCRAAGSWAKSRSAHSFIMWWKRKLTPSGRRVTKAFCWVRARSTSSASGRAVTARAISTVNSSASPITARKPRVFSGRDSSMAAVNMA